MYRRVLPSWVSASKSGNPAKNKNDAVLKSCLPSSSCFCSFTFCPSLPSAPLIHCPPSLPAPLNRSVSLPFPAPSRPLRARLTGSIGTSLGGHNGLSLLNTDNVEKTKSTTIATVHPSPGVTADASSCDTLPSADGREYNKTLEEEWANGAVSALKEPWPAPEAKEAAAAAAAAAGAAEREDGGGGGADEGGRVGGTEGEVALLLACLCRGLGTTFVVRVPEILGR